MFFLPKTFQPSKQIEPGETFEVIAEVMLGEDGRYALGKLDGQKLEDEAEDSEEPGESEESEESEGEFDRMVRNPSEGLEV